LIGAHRKWPAEAETDAIDPKAKSPLSVCTSVNGG
jgi:hypothetical protein